jgi:hypothetical protein
MNTAWRRRRRSQAQDYCGAPPIEFVIHVSEMMEGHRDQRKINELDLNPAILYHKEFALVDARMILAEPAIRPRAVDTSRDRLMTRQVIFDAQTDCGNS